MDADVPAGTTRPGVEYVSLTDRVVAETMDSILNSITNASRNSDNLGTNSAGRGRKRTHNVDTPDTTPDNSPDRSWARRRKRQRIVDTPENSPTLSANYEDVSSAEDAQSVAKSSSASPSPRRKKHKRKKSKNRKKSKRDSKRRGKRGSKRRGKRGSSSGSRASSGSRSSSGSRASSTSPRKKRKRQNSRYLKRVSKNVLKYDFAPHQLVFQKPPGKKFTRKRLPNKACRVLLSHCSKRFPTEKDLKPHRVKINLERIK